MKKLLIFLLSALSLTVFAQKQVAMLEPLVVAGNVKPIEKSMIRGEMTKAIASQSGYSAFSRTDIDQIMMEQNFQQSGMVDDNTRKRIGAMQGVDYVCITKITKEGNAYYLEANLLNIESGQISSPATQYGELQNGGFGNMREVCIALACDLLGVPMSSKGTNTTNNNDVQSIYQKGYDYYFGENGMPQDKYTAIKYFQQAAEQGHVVAQYVLGYSYYYGEGVAEDNYAAVSWFLKAAEQGDDDAQYYLGLCYYRGHGVTEDDYAAVSWFRKAAEQGNKEAQYRLGDCYYLGHGVTEDYYAAVSWFRKAAEQGEAGAQYSLGECYYYGDGVSKDYYAAVGWYRKAAEQGNIKAQVAVGECYYEGRGVSKDYYAAVRWWRQAAEQGDDEGQYNLGYCYEYGDGVTKDTYTAKSWYRKAAEQGNEAAKKALERL